MGANETSTNAVLAEPDVVSTVEGELVAVFSGNHGWFWRNRGQADVTVILQTRGQYREVKRVM